MSQDAARFSLRPTLCPTLGVTEHRPLGGHLDCHDVLSVFGARHQGTGRWTTRLVERPRKPKPTRSTPRYLPEAFARHQRDIARASPAAQDSRVVVMIATAAWHRGALVTVGPTDGPPLARSRLPSDSPKLPVSERFWKVLRRRATPNRLCPTMAQLKPTLRSSGCYYQTLQHRVLSIIESPRTRTKSSAA